MEERLKERRRLIAINDCRDSTNSDVKGSDGNNGFDDGNNGNDTSVPESP
jgi:hypothetical protein